MPTPAEAPLPENGTQHVRNASGSGATGPFTNAQLHVLAEQIQSLRQVMSLAQTVMSSWHDLSFEICHVS